MKICLVQMNCSNDTNENVQKATRFIRRAAKQKADLICLPELFLNDEPPYAEVALDSTILKEFKTLAHTLNVNIILGSVAFRREKIELPTNTSFVIDRKGDIIYSYDKNHLYKTNSVEFSFDETKLFSAGKDAGFFELEGTKFGLGICFDIRFSEYFKKLKELNAEVIVLPTCLREATAKIACKVLPIARALETQSYVLTCNQTGGKGGGKKCGNSAAVRFDGKALSTIRKKEGLIYVEIDRAKLHEFRKKFQLYN